MSDLDETDAALWHQQVALLRRMANGERVDDLVDWENVIEEVATCGSATEDEIGNRLPCSARTAEVAFPAREAQQQLA